MKDKARLKALEDYAREVEQGLPFAEDFINKDSNIEKNALRARSLAEDSLAQQVLKNTGIPIPDTSAPVKTQEDFMAQIFKERYPELEPNIRILPDEKIQRIVGQQTSGYYQPETEFKKPEIVINENELKRGGTVKGIGTLFHEAGHQYDDKILKASTDELDLETLRKLVREGVDLKNMDPAEVYELYGAKHHAKIPNLREGTYGLGALKSYLKSGTFKGLAPVLAKGAGAVAGGALSLAAEAADVEEEGSALEQAALMREISDRKAKEQILNNIPEQNRKAVEQDLDERSLGLRRTALKDLIRK